jgi:hypothetical protein
VAAFDSSGEGPVKDFYVSAPIDTPPVVTASNFQMAKGQTSVADSTLFTASDPDGDTITQYAVFDATAGSGHFEVGGVVQPSAVAGFYLTPQQYQSTTFIAGPSGSSDHIYVAAFDGSGEGPVTSFSVTTPIDTPPVVTASNFQMATAQTSVAASTLFSAGDPDGDTITQYAVFDATPGSGHFEVSGVVQPSAVAGFYLTPQQYQATTFVAGPNGSSDQIYVAAFDSSGEGPVTSFYVSSQVDTPPIVTASNFQMAAGQTSVAASSLFTASDPDGDAITKYAVFDATAGSGNFNVGGAAKASGVAGFYITPQEYQTTSFVAGPNGHSDHIYVAAFDSSGEGPVTDFYVSSPPLFAVTLNDPSQLPQDAALLADMNAAAADWAQYLSGLGTVNIQLTVAPTTRASGGPAAVAPGGTDGARTVYQSDAVYEMLTGTQYQGATTDINITVDPTYLQNVLWLDPNPSSPSAIPSNRIDGVTVLRHELAHGLGTSTYRDLGTGALPADHEMTWDELTQIHSDGSAWFTGANAESVYGGPVPVTTLQNGEQYAHLGNSVNDADGQDLMNGIRFDDGKAYHISSLDLAIMKDLGAPVTTLTPQSGPQAAGAPAGTPTGTSGIPAPTQSAPSSVALLGQHLASSLAPGDGFAAPSGPDPLTPSVNQSPILTTPQGA